MASFISPNNIVVLRQPQVESHLHSDSELLVLDQEYLLFLSEPSHTKIKIKKCPEPNIIGNLRKDKF